MASAWLLRDRRTQPLPLAFQLNVLSGSACSSLSPPLDYASEPGESLGSR